MNFETIKFDLQENGIGLLTLNRPEKLNAMSFQMIEDLNKLFDHLKKAGCYGLTTSGYKEDKVC